MSEQLKNSTVSTLASGMDGSQTTLSVASASSFPTAGVFTVIVDNEIMKVTGVSGTTLTVVRGQEGTSAASHSTSAAVTRVDTQRSLEDLRAEFITSGTFSSLSQGRKGRLYLPSDSMLAVYDDGSALNYLGPEIHMMKPFVTGSFTWSNQGTGTVTDLNGVTILTAPARTPDSLRMLEINLPAAPWSVLMCLTSPMPQARYLTAGPHMRESGTGKIRTFGFASTGASPGDGYIENINWTNNTTYLSDSSFWPNSMLGNGRELFWHKLFYDGTNIYYSVGPTKDCLAIYDVRAKNYHFTTAPDKVGIHTNSNAAGADSILNIYHWEEGTS